MDDKAYPHEQPLPENVVTLSVVTSHDIDPEQILRGAYNAGIVDICIVGMTADGKEYFASSMSDAAEAMYHLQRGIHKLNNIVDQSEQGGEDVEHKS